MSFIFQALEYLDSLESCILYYIHCLNLKVPSRYVSCAKYLALFFCLEFGFKFNAKEIGVKTKSVLVHSPFRDVYWRFAPGDFIVLNLHLHGRNLDDFESGRYLFIGTLINSQFDLNAVVVQYWLARDSQARVVSLSPTLSVVFLK